MVLKRDREVQVRYQEEVFHTEGRDTLEQAPKEVAVPGGIQGQAGCGSGQPGLVVGDPAHSREVETR